MTSKSVREGLDKCLKHIESMSEEERQKMAEDFWNFINKRHDEERTATQEYIAELKAESNLIPEVLKQIERVVDSLTTMPWIEPEYRNLVLLEYQDPLRGFLCFMLMGDKDVGMTFIDINQKRTDSTVSEKDIPDKVRDFFNSTL